MIEFILKGINLLNHMGSLSRAQSFIFTQYFPGVCYKKSCKVKFGAETSKFDLILPKLTMIKWWKEVEFVMTLLVNVFAALLQRKKPI